MATDEHLGPSSGSSLSSAASANEGETPIPLPPLPIPRSALAATDRATGHKLLDGLLFLLLLVFAFLLASFPARNSDLFLHLGAGKLLAQGKYVFGVDPFASTTKGVYWANSSWLFDLLAYGIYSLFPDFGLVVCKALVIAATAFALVLAGWSGRSLWTPIACAGLAILALGTRVPMNSLCFSYLFLAVLIWLLERPGVRASDEEETSRPSSLASYWPIPILFALWANLDGWLVLGLVVVALYAVGAVLQLVLRHKEAPGAKPASALTLGIVLLFSAAACLLNPHHYHVFDLPPELGLSAAFPILQQEPGFAASFISPFDGRYFHSPTGLSVSSLAYYTLIAVSLLSFATNGRNLRWQHVLTWLGLLLLSAYQARAIPFFALAAGPIAAHNFQSFHAARFGAAQPSANMQGWAVSGRGLTLLIGLVLLVLAWPGWLQASPYELRRWSLESDGGLQQAARQLRQWHEQRVLNEETPGLVLSPETANQLAYWYPEERGFMDSRLSLFSADTARDYVAVRAAILGPAPSGETAAPNSTNWRDVLRRRRIHHLLVHDADANQMRQSLEWLSARADEFPLLYLQDGVAIFGWRDPELRGQPDPFAAVRLDLNRQAFHPSPDKRAPAQWPGREPLPAAWYDAFVKPRPGRAQDREEAALYLAYFDAQLGPIGKQNDDQWDSSRAAAAVGFPGGGNLAAAAVDQAFRVQLGTAVRYEQPASAEPSLTPLEIFTLNAKQTFLFSRDDGPPAAALLAIRAARRAVHANPDDAKAYVLLGKAYLALTTETSERTALLQVELLTQIRRIQAVTAFHHALFLQPDLAEAHIRLAQIYLEMKPLPFGDMVLKHLREAATAYKATGPAPGESAQQFQERLNALDKQIAGVDLKVQQALDLYESGSANFKILDKAKRAIRNGLPAKALELLLASDYAAFGASGLRLELELLLISGRARDVREWMEPTHEEDLGVDYNRLRVLLFAATGDYEAADEDLKVMASIAAHELPYRPEAVRAEMASILGEAVLNGSYQYGVQVTAIVRALSRGFYAVDYVAGLAVGLRDRADVNVIRALLLLEQGDDVGAKQLLQENVADFYISPQAARSGAGIDFPARSIGQRYLQLMK